MKNELPDWKKEPYLNVDSSAVAGSVSTDNKKCGKQTLRYNLADIKGIKEFLNNKKN